MSDTQTLSVDAVVIGAGFGGIYMLHKLRNGLGLKVRAYDKAGGVGGTWYWNKYPGALSDTEAQRHSAQHQHRVVGIQRCQQQLDCYRRRRRDRHRTACRVRSGPALENQPA